ncbi:MAG: histidine phosphatase family protein [Psychrobacter sp.]|jgi:phosphohistidine phosphatase|uniref:SixA phosphatase family protein n=1 Tax=Psychrobacter namhaensis TaxID=292734 RepID=A0ABW8L617_9GAMM|nr:MULTISPECIES: phosphoglycerate mutase family protein [Psychrobacter]MCD1279278.1 phosphohistidine phosphatase SixA [Psychrobacter sp. CCUG 69069]MCD6252665.1 histidine phosphatase family protein [Psychrobacter sp.]HCN17312.1 phosphohistidine phosphatase SixA [Psychrobacter sp.]
MKIILVRHGQAEDETRPDSARQLTEFGQQQAAQTAEYVTSHYHPDRFIVSPYERAQQTLAEFQSRASEVPVTIQDNITPSDEARKALVDLANVEAECIVVVCHMSIIAHLAGLLTGEYPESFSLAEARVLEMDFVMSGMASEIDRFVPDQPY